jgi:hypothetical protein
MVHATTAATPLEFDFDDQGQTSGRGRCRSMFTPGSRACAYKTASGRRKWLNRDPLGEPGFELVASGSQTDKQSLKERQWAALNALRLRVNNPTLIMLIDRKLSKLKSFKNGDLNLYLFVKNDPIDFLDNYGLYCLNTPNYCYFCFACIAGTGPEDPLCWYPCAMCAGGSLN